MVWTSAVSGRDSAADGVLDADRSRGVDVFGVHAAWTPHERSNHHPVVSASDVISCPERMTDRAHRTRTPCKTSGRLAGRGHAGRFHSHVNGVRVRGQRAGACNHEHAWVESACTGHADSRRCPLRVGRCPQSDMFCPNGSAGRAQDADALQNKWTDGARSGDAWTSAHVRAACTRLQRVDGH